MANSAETPEITDIEEHFRGMSDDDLVGTGAHLLLNTYIICDGSPETKLAVDEIVSDVANGTQPDNLKADTPCRGAVATELSEAFFNPEYPLRRESLGNTAWGAGFIAELVRRNAIAQQSLGN